MAIFIASTLHLGANNVMVSYHNDCHTIMYVITSYNTSPQWILAILPGMEFCQMAFGLSGAPSSFQCLMDKTLQDFSFVTVHSKNE